MLNTKTSPVGIDWYIQQLQTALHNNLLAKWSLPTTQYISYGRCYRNRRDTGYVAEWYNSTTADYKDAYWDDTVSAVSFFGAGTSVRRDIMHEADVHLVFFVNLKKIKPLISHRADEEMRKDVTSVFGRYLKGFTMTGVETSVDNVLREYPGSRRDERLKSIDMHPVHCFRLNLTLVFDPNKIS